MEIINSDWSFVHKGHLYINYIMGYQVKIGREMTKNLMSLVLEAAPQKVFL